jgi:hypothetical protein
MRKLWLLLLVLPLLVITFVVKAATVVDSHWIEWWERWSVHNWAKVGMQISVNNDCTLTEVKFNDDTDHNDITNAYLYDSWFTTILQQVDIDLVGNVATFDYPLSGWVDYLVMFDKGQAEDYNFSIITSLVDAYPVSWTNINWIAWIAWWSQQLDQLYGIESITTTDSSTGTTQNTNNMFHFFN